MNTLFKLPRQPYILACSGGADSMAALAFLRNGRHDFEAAHFHHGTVHAREALEFVIKTCTSFKVPLHIGYISSSKNKDESPEEYYRRERYGFLSSFNKKIITAHHLDDCVETWIFSSINGKPKLISYVTPTCFRPFLTTTKEDMKKFAIANKYSWVEDPSNKENYIPRNCIRNEIIPMIKKVNPGIQSMVRRMLENKFKKEEMKNEQTQ